MAFYAGQKLKASNLGQLDHYAQYQSSAGQVIGTAADTVLAFGTDNITSSLVTKSTTGAGHKFTLNAAGIWSITATARFPGTATGQRAAHFKDSLGLWIHSTSQPASATAPAGLHLTITKYFAANDTVQFEVYQDSGGNITTDSNSTLAWGRIDIVCILKEG